jgi:hypothetical protein
MVIGVGSLALALSVSVSIGVGVSEIDSRLESRLGLSLTYRGDS